MLVDSQLQNGKVDSGVESETTLVWTQSRVELDSETPVDGDRSIVSLPNDSEVDDSLRNRDDLKCPTVVWVLDEEWLEGRGDLMDSLLSAKCPNDPKLTCWNSGSVGRLDILDRVCSEV
jgi:hypothetical protein